MHNIQKIKMNFLNYAIDISKTSPNSHHKHGALLVRNKIVVASGTNTSNYHAEINAIRQFVGKGF